MNILEKEDLLEQHPELRLKFFENGETGMAESGGGVAAQGSRLTDRPGAYEWWQFEAFDAEGSGICLLLYNGDPFHPRYRRAVRRNWSGQPVEPADLRPTTFPAARVSIFEKKTLIARGHWAPGPRSCVVSGQGKTWAAKLGPISITTLPDGEGWHLQIKEAGTQRLGFKGFALPAREGGRRIHQIDLKMVPTFPTTTIQRAAMPDSPDGSTHDWLIVCPAGTVSGKIEISPLEMGGEGEKPIQINLGPAAFGSLQHFWGNGMLGNGMRRWYRGSLLTAEGAIFVELPVIRKYIQLAGTIMYFAPANKLPWLIRCDHERAAGYQRSAWLLAHPLAMGWRNDAAKLELNFNVPKLHDAQPFRGLSLNETQFEAGEVPDELVIGPGLGIFEILQPGRADLKIWKHYLA